MTRTPQRSISLLGQTFDRDGRRGPAVAPGSRQALCLWLPTFELRLELVRSPELDSTSVALLTPEESSRRQIWQISERAASAGVQTGMLVSQAISLCTSLTLLEPDPTHYDTAMEQMLEVLSSVSPVVEPAGRGRVYMGMDGLGRLYGAPIQQVHRALESLFRVLPKPLVAATRAGFAPGKFGAWVAAAGARPGAPVLIDEDGLRPFLDGQPVSALPVELIMIQRLERLGIRTLGELSRIPEPALVGQFGDGGRQALAWSIGQRIDPVRPWHRPRPIRVTLDFPTPIGQLETLHGGLDRLLERGLSRPARRGRSIQSLRLGASLEGGGSWVVDAVLRESSAERDRLAFVLRSRMNLTPPPRAVETLFVEFYEFGAPASQAALFDRKEESGRSAGGWEMRDGSAPPTLRDAIRELKLRLGYSPLYRVVEMDPLSRIPERRHALLSFDP